MHKRKPRPGCSGGTHAPFHSCTDLTRIGGLHSEHRGGVGFTLRQDIARDTGPTIQPWQNMVTMPTYAMTHPASCTGSTLNDTKSMPISRDPYCIQGQALHAMRYVLLCFRAISCS